MVQRWELMGLGVSLMVLAVLAVAGVRGLDDPLPQCRSGDLAGMCWGDTSSWAGNR